MALVCGNCGQDESFMAAQTVQETVRLDGNEEFVEVVDADTKDRYDLWCAACGSHVVRDKFEGCSECGAEIDLEGYDGRCGNCSDRKEKV